MELPLDEPPRPSGAAAADQGAAKDEGAEQASSSSPITAASSSPITAVFLHLLPDIASCMPRTAWVLRLLCTEAAATLRGKEHCTVHLSEPAPEAEFRWRWCGPQSLRSTTFEQRKQLEELTARSGVVANLEALLEARGDCTLLSRPPCAWAWLFALAAGAGRLELCQWLHEQRGMRLTAANLGAAAKGGHADVCEWLLDRGCKWDRHAVAAALSHGHVRLAERLLRLRPLGSPIGDKDALALVKAAAHGCNLATLQRLYDKLIDRRGLDLTRFTAGGLLFAAAGSPTPDWAVKVEWLEETVGCADTSLAADAAAGCADGAARLLWLGARGYPTFELSTMRAAIKANRIEAVLLILRFGEQLDPAALSMLASDAAASGCLQAVAVLASKGGRPSARALKAAAVAGHRIVVPWVVQQYGTGDAAAVLTADLFQAAARSGSRPLLWWLREHGCPWDVRAFTSAAEAGSEEVLEWLAKRGCPMGGGAYVAAAAHHDLQTLRCLKRLGCPFAADGSTFMRAVVEVGRRPPFDPWPLQWLLDAGCPVKWQDKPKGRRAKEVLDEAREWLAQQRQQRA